MIPNKPFKKLEGKIEKIRIPDEDVLNWIGALTKEGFSEEEIDNILINLNDTYKKVKQPEKFLLEEILIETKNYIAKKWDVYPTQIFEDFLRRRISDLIDLIINQSKIHKEELSKSQIFDDVKQKVLNLFKKEVDDNMPIVLKELELHF